MPKRKNHYKSLIAVKRKQGLRHHFELLSVALLNAGYVEPRGGSQRLRLEHICSTRAGVDVLKVPFGSGFVRFVKEEDVPRYMDWLGRHIAECARDAYDLKFSIGDVDSDVEKITSSIELRLPEAAPEVASEVVELQPTNAPGGEPEHPGMVRLKAMLNEMQSGVLERIETLAQLVERQQSLLNEQTTAIAALNEELSKRHQPVPSPATIPTTEPRTFFGRLFG